MKRLSAGGDLGDDGARALFTEAVTKDIVVLDVASGTTEFLTTHAPTAAAAGPTVLSGDGRRFVSASNSYLGNTLSVWERDPTGSWSVIAQLEHDAGGNEGPVAIDRTGSRVAYAIRHGSQDGFQIQLYDVASDAALFDLTFDSTGSTLQNIVSDLCVDDAGRTVAGPAGARPPSASAEPRNRRPARVSSGSELDPWPDAYGVMLRRPLLAATPTGPAGSWIQYW